MARGRMLNRKAFLNVKLAHIYNGELGLGAWMVWTALIANADREGRVHGNAHVVKSFMPLAENISHAFIDQVLQQLSDAGFVQLYEVDGTTYVQLPKFPDNQRGLRVNREPPSDLPEPTPQNVVKTNQKPPSCRQDGSNVAPDCHHVGGLREGKGREKKGREGKEKEPAEQQVKTKFPEPPTDLPPLPSSVSSSVSIPNPDDMHGACDGFPGEDPPHSVGTYEFGGDVFPRADHAEDTDSIKDHSENFSSKPSMPMTTIDDVTMYVANVQHWQVELKPKQVINATQLLDDAPITDVEARYAASEVNKKTKARERNAGLFLSIIDTERSRIESMPKPGSEHAAHEKARKQGKKKEPRKPKLTDEDLTLTDAQREANKERLKEITEALAGKVEADA